MTDKRVDLYTLFHKGIRKLLFDLIVLAGRTDFRSPSSVEDFTGESRRVFSLLREHARLEETILHPALEERASGAAGAADDEHGEEEDHMRSIEAHLATVASAAAEDRPALGLQLYRAINRFCSNYLLHLATEEEALMPQFWENFSDKELAELRARLHAGVSPERMSAWLAEVLPAFSHSERTTMLEGLRAAGSTEAFNSACSVARASLDDEAWSALATDLRL